MGEAWSDWYAQDYIVAAVPVARHRGRRRGLVGAYVERRGGSALLRTQPLDCPVGGRAARARARPASAPAATRTATSGTIAGAPEVHADGEIWGRRCGTCGRRWASARAESLVDGRDGAAAAGAVVPGRAQRDPAGRSGAVRRRGRGRDLDRLRQARHGLLRGGDRGGDTSPWESFSPPPAAGRADGDDLRRITDSMTGAPIAGAKVGIAGPLGLLAGTGADGRYTISGRPAGDLPEGPRDRTRAMTPRCLRCRSRAG